MNAREINELTRHELEALHDEMLDEIYEPYRMGSMNFMPSDILKSDPGAYNKSVLDYEDSLLRDAEDEDEDEEEES